MSNEHDRQPNMIKFLLIMVIIIAIFVVVLLRKSDKTNNVVPGIEEQENTIVLSNVSDGGFSDGLNNPTTVNRAEPDEFGAGMTEVAEYTYDINQDGHPDKITRTRIENGTAHFQYVYKIELNDGNQMLDITPNEFYTIEGAECALQKIQFSFEPDFSITKISRPLGDDWNMPTQSIKRVYSLWGNKIHTVSEIVYKTACDVSELF